MWPTHSLTQQQSANTWPQHVPALPPPPACLPVHVYPAHASRQERREGPSESAPAPSLILLNFGQQLLHAVPHQRLTLGIALEEVVPLILARFLPRPRCKRGSCAAEGGRPRGAGGADVGHVCGVCVRARVCVPVRARVCMCVRQGQQHAEAPKACLGPG